MDLLALRNEPETIAERTAAICDAVRRESVHIRAGNFTAIAEDDLALLFRLYDEAFFGGQLGPTTERLSGAPLKFRLSPTMTRCGGKTIRHYRRERGGRRLVGFEIAVATKLLFLTFQDVQRPVTVCGCVCTDRLQALQRILEHEICHLAELLILGRSGCASARFRALTANLFGHTDRCHDLVTPRERAAVRHDVRPGDTVVFAFAGHRRVGCVNRIHHRATVLVESPDGVRYTNGKTYRKYYIPLPMLEIVKGERGKAGV